MKPQGAGGWTFTGWEGADAGDVETGDVIVMDADKKVKAVFAELFTLKTSTKGKGTVAASPQGPRYGSGSTVELTATPNADQSWTFVQWQKDVSGTQNPTNLVMNSDKHAKAVFTRTGKKTLTITTPEGCWIKVSANPNGTSDGQNPTAPGRTVLQFTTTSQVTLNVHVDKEYRGRGYRFVRWEGDVPAGQQSDDPLTITVDSDKSIEAVLEETFRLKVDTEGPGSVSVNPQSPEGRYVSGTQVSLSATPTIDFYEWTGAVGANTPVTSITMDSNKYVVARFRPGIGGEPFVYIEYARFRLHSPVSEASVMLAPSGLSGPLTVTLLGPASSYQFFSGTGVSGSQKAIGATSSIPPGTYDTVRARWTVNGGSYYDDCSIAEITIPEEADDDPIDQPDSDDDSDPVADQAEDDQEPSTESTTADQEADEADPLLLHSGEFMLRETDLHIEGRGLDFEWARTYRSRIPSSTYLGKNWDFSYNIYLKRNPQNVVLLHDGSRARRDKFIHVTSGRYEKAGFFGYLQENVDTTYTLHFEDGTKWHFAAITPAYSGGSPEIGKITQIEDRSGNHIDFTYDILKNLVSITDTMGRTIELDYWDNRIARVRCLSREVEYTYYKTGDAGGPKGDLKTVRSPVVNTGLAGHDFPQGKVRLYTYTQGFADSARNHNLLTVTNGAGEVYLQNTYSSESDPQAFAYDRVVRQIWGRVSDGIDNDTVDLTYIQNPASPPGAPGIQAAVKTIVNDRNGHVTEYYYDSRNRTLLAREYTGSANPLSPTTETVNRPASKLRPTDPDYYDTRMTYNDQDLTLSVTYPNGNSVSYQYDSGTRIKEGNLLTVSYSTGETLTFTYLDGFGSRNLRDFVTEAVDANGNVTKRSYDTSGNCTRIERWNPAETQLVSEHDYTFNSYGQLTSHTHPSNGTARRVDEFVYDGDGGYPEQVIVDNAGAALTTGFVRDAFGEVVETTGPFGNVTEFVVNALGQTVRETKSVKDADGATKTYQTDYYYDAANRLAQMVRQDAANSADAVAAVYTYDELGKLLSTTRYKGGYSSGSGTWIDPVSTTLAYDDNRNLIAVLSPEGRETRLFYDERDHLYERHEGYGTADVCVTRLSYDGNGNVLSVLAGVGPDQRQFQYTYTGRNLLSTIDEPLGDVVEFDYDDNGNVTLAQGRNTANDLVFEYTQVFDPLDRLVSRTEKIFDLAQTPPVQTGTSTTTWTYYPNSSLQEVTNPNGHSIAITYDSAGRRLNVSDELGNTTSYAYGGQQGVGIITKTTAEQSDLQALGVPGFVDQTIQTEMHLDGLKRLLKAVEKRTQQADLVTKFGYDSRGNRTRIVGARGETSTFAFDGLNRLIQSNLPEGVTHNRSWDDDSLLLSETDGLNHTTAYAYDALGRLTQETTADSEVSTYGYNVFGELTEVTDFNGTGITLLRDDLGRVTLRTVDPALGVDAPSVPEVFSYDSLSNLVYAENDAAVIERSFNSLGGLLSESLTFKSDSSEYTTTGTYDVGGNLTNLSYPSGRTVTHTFDALERVSQVTSNQGGTLATYRYLGPGSRVERRIHGNGTWADFAFDDLGRIVGSSHKKPNGLGGDTILDARSYTWDAAHNMTGRTDTRTGGPEPAFVYEYDDLSRMTQSILTPGTGDPVTREYALDAAGNRDAVTETVGQGTPVVEDYSLLGDDALVNAYYSTQFDEARAYDANGNLTLAALGPYIETIYEYDYRNLMTHRSENLTLKDAQYTYDALGRRIQKTVDGVTTRYIYHGARVIEERNGAGVLQSSYVYGNYIDEVLTLRRGAADYYYHSDAQWNTVALTDAAGDVVERYEYGDYGAPEFYDAAGTPLAGSLVGNPSLFTGQRYDVETGFYWYKSRYLEPRTGRFTSRDPIGLWGDPLNLGNPYTYTGNNPWSWLDPYGLCTDTDGEKEKSWWERLNTPSEGNDARSMFPLYDVEMRDWEGITPYEDPDYVAQNLGNARNDDPHWRASTGNLNEVMQQGKYSGMRDGMITIVGGTIGGAGGGNLDDVTRASRRLGTKLDDVVSDVLEQHHQLPKQFREQFEKVGLNIDDYVITLPQGSHRLKPDGLHTGTENWNKQWREFFKEHENPSKEVILDQLDKMRRDFGLE